MKKHFTLLFFFFFICSSLWAEDIYFDITQFYDVWTLEHDLQNIIDRSIPNDRIIVTGSRADAYRTLTITIPENITVIWQATYQATPDMPGTLILLYDNGTFEVSDGSIVTFIGGTIYAEGTSSTIIVSGTGKVRTSGDDRSAIATHGNVEIRDNAEISSTTREAIAAIGNSSKVTVSGGTISATSGNAIVAYGHSSKVYVSGGVVSNDATEIHHVIYMIDRNNTELNVTVSGTGKIVAKAKGYAVATSGAVVISENAQVIANDHAAVYDSRNLTLCDRGKIISTKNFAIGSSTGDMEIEIKDNSQVIANASCAIFLPYNKRTVTVSGGLVFAHTNAISNVIGPTAFAGPSGNGIILAWDKAAGNTTYELNTATDISKLPKSATAFWDTIDTQHGISYANGENTGFIPLEVTVELSVSESPLSNLSIYPNPSNGQFVVSCNKTIESFELYDAVGRKVFTETPKTESTQINIQLPQGLYIYRAVLQDHAVCSGKVVVQ
jgi:hypothetical protein